MSSPECSRTKTNSAPDAVPEEPPNTSRKVQEGIPNSTKESSVQDNRSHEPSSLAASLTDEDAILVPSSSSSSTIKTTVKEESNIQDVPSSQEHSVQVKLPDTVKVSNTRNAFFDKEYLESGKSTVAANKARQGPSTPESKRIYRGIPSSTDSSYDEMTLAELKSLVNGQPYNPGAPKYAAMHSAKRSLSSALNVASSDAENIDPQRQATVGGVNVLSMSLKRCVPLLPIPSECSCTMDEAMKITLSEDFSSFVNFPQFRGVMAVAGKRSCVMCGNLRPCLKKRSDKDGDIPYILSENRGVCSLCEAVPWTLVDGNIDIKFCQQCTHFKPLALLTARRSSDFVSTCIPCRDRKKERAKNRKEARARRAESDGTAAVDDKAEAAPALGKRQASEASDGVSITSDSDSSKRTKVESSADAKIKEDVEMSTIATETPSSHDEASLDRNCDGPDAATSSYTNEEGALPNDVERARKEENAPVHASPAMSSSGRNRCVPLSSVPTMCSSTLKQSKKVVLPAFQRLVNFPQHSPAPEKRGPKQCVMCGERRFVKKRKDVAMGLIFIPFGNKCVCTECESIAWEIVKTKAKVKWCKQGCHFRPLESFLDPTSGGERPVLRASCHSCRDLATGYK